MKKILFLLLTFAWILPAQAQMDEMFYFPGKKWVEPIGLKYEEITFKADTETLTGILLKPEKKPKVTVLFFHGAGGNVTSYTFMTQPLVKQGYQVLMVDFRGYGKSSGRPTHLNIAQDGQIVLDELLKRKDVQGTKVILYGASMGTQVATKLARDNQNKIAALILDGTISSFTDLAAAKSPETQREMILKSLPSPYAAKEDIKYLKKLPKLFIHSREDQDIPYSQAETVFANAPEPKAFLVYKGKHLEAMKHVSGEIILKIEELLKFKK